MRLKMFSVFDVKAGAYLPPFSLGNEQLAKRAFIGACGDANHQFARNPEDYTLFGVGEFDDASGVITVYESPRYVMTALEAKSAIERRAEAAGVRLAAGPDGKAEEENVDG